MELDFSKDPCIGQTAELLGMKGLGSNGNHVHKNNLNIEKGYLLHTTWTRFLDYRPLEDFHTLLKAQT